MGGAERAGSDLARLLGERVRGDVDFGASARALVTMDASNYRRVPLGVVAPRDAEDVAAVLRTCAEAEVPVGCRGGGTSIAGQATGTGVVLDFTRYMTGLVSLDPEARTAVVRPGLVLDRLREAAAPHGLVFGPDPSTRSRCTLGGMIGNNACGAHSVAWGTTADNLVEVSVLRYGTDAGDVRRLSTGWDGTPPGLRELVGANLALLRTRFGAPAGPEGGAAPGAGGNGPAAGPAFTRRISGYALDELLPERGVRAARAFCGGEGTLGVVTEAVVRLVELPREPVLVVLGYPDESAAAEAAAGLLPHGPLTVEGMAADLVGGVEGARRLGLPRGAAWLFVELAEAGAAPALVRAADALAAVTVRDPARQRALWRIREDAAGTATRMPDGSMAWPGWEDCAVPPARLGAYLREFRALLAAHGLRGVPYGHFGEGCVHVRIDFDLVTPRGLGVFRAFSEELAELVASHGGSLSGEHGDGQARAELLDRVYGPEAVRLFAAYKDLWDPAGGLNPGILTRPARLDENLRFGVLAGAAGRELPLAAGVTSCVGVAKCRTTAPAAAGVMCPSYRVTGEERHSTRGRARLLHEMLAGEVVRDGWRSTEVREALDLCLGCKGCLSDCPVGVDMAAYKAEFLDRHWAGRVRPAAHYTMGGLPDWLRLLAALRLSGPAGALAARLPAGLRGLAGLTPERELPRPAAEPFTRWWARAGGGARPGAGAGPGGGGTGPGGAGPVLLWPDTFTEYLAPGAGRAAVRVLRAAGLSPVLPAGRVCCGLTYVSTGRLGRARRVLGRTLDVLEREGVLGAPGGGGADGPEGAPTGRVLVLEPSCAAALRDDLPRLLPADPRAARLAAAVRTFAQGLEEWAPDWAPARLDRPVVGQTHCHQHAVLGDGAERRLRERAGLDGELTGGCCGLAGDFGFARGGGRYAVSVACAEERLLPAVRAAAPGTTFLADGFSCRTQLAQLGGVRARHLAEVLAEGLPGTAASGPGEGAADEVRGPEGGGADGPAEGRRV
ncbi:FAD-binding and (Fe-S)-binding domain-containing protein [Streptomyces sp. NPDC097619]|uniref:FAD-binding and (Fe-S)-binding domain-containing protein n=1 Tax=Streptomyces sp. NPDC097619 TaxID=3157228 RepID=UPI00332AF1B5